MGVITAQVNNFINPMAVRRTALSRVRGDPLEHLEQQEKRIYEQFITKKNVGCAFMQQRNKIRMGY